MIQPAYNWGSERMTSALEWRLGVQTLYALTESATNTADTIAAAEGGLRWVNFPNRALTGKWMFAADGAAGASFSGDAYTGSCFAAAWCSHRSSSAGARSASMSAPEARGWATPCRAPASYRSRSTGTSPSRSPARWAPGRAVAGSR